MSPLMIFLFIQSFHFRITATKLRSVSIILDSFLYILANQTSSRTPQLSAASIGAEPDPLVGDVVRDGERLLLRVAEDGDGRVVAVGRERQARLRHLRHVQHAGEVEAHGGAAFEQQRHLGDLRCRVAGEVVARVEDGQRGGLLVLPHVPRERRPERRVGARREAGDHRAGVDHRAPRRREHRRGDPYLPAANLDADEVEVVERRVVAVGHHRRELRVRRRGVAEGQVPVAARRRRQAVGEARPVVGRPLRRQRHLLAAKAEEPVGLAEQPGVGVAAAEDEARELGGRRQRERVTHEVAVGLRLVAVRDLVPALVRRAGPRVELLALLRAAGHGGVRRRLRRVEQRVVLLVAVAARRALHPRQVAAGVEHHRVLLRRRSEPHGHDVVAGAKGDAPLRRQGHALRGACRVDHGRAGGGDLAVDGVDPGLVAFQDLDVRRRAAATGMKRRARAVLVHDAESRRVRRRCRAAQTEMSNAMQLEAEQPHLFLSFKH
uniref:Uncharacterized protein n=1 Tax=Oryza brachyantha TaxID=4533 RepID=J3MYK1_ORYBR